MPRSLLCSDRFSVRGRERGKGEGEGEGKGREKGGRRREGRGGEGGEGRGGGRGEERSEVAIDGNASSHSPQESTAKKSDIGTISGQILVRQAPPAFLCLTGDAKVVRRDHSDDQRGSDGYPVR